MILYNSNDLTQIRKQQNIGTNARVIVTGQTVRGEVGIMSGSDRGRVAVSYGVGIIKILLVV